jgi:S1-C subfamily serine protease
MRATISYFYCFVLSVLVCITCCSCYSNVLQRQSFSGVDVAKHASNATVALVYQENGDTHVFCSGVWVSKDVILTASHCVDGLTEHINTKLIEESPDDSIPQGLVHAYGLTVPYVVENEVVNVEENTAAIHNSTAYVLDRRADLALLIATNPKSVPAHDIAHLANKQPEVGEQLGIVGHPGGLYWTYMNGTVSAYRDSMKSAGMKSVDGPFMQVSADVWHGSSGGGAFNSDGELVGIASFLKSDTPAAAFFIHTYTIRNMLCGARIIPVVIDTTQPDPSLD